MYRRYFKRIIDLVLSCLSILVLAWLFVILALAIKITSRGPVFFKQKRIGIYKKEFNILKFRTMYVHAPKDMPTHLMMDSNQYITPIGRFLRKTSFDELPQLFNILLGQMSIIGPRPALWNQYDLINERDKYGANDVLPGLTGWAQINGRDEIEISLKASYDGEYVQKLSFLFDFKIFMRTFYSVYKHLGVKEGGTGEMKE